MNQRLVGSPDLGGQLGRPVNHPPTPLRIAAIVVTHNRLAQLEHTIERLLTEPVDLVVLVDNGSSDGTAERFGRINDPRFHLICLPTNRGGAGGFEEGLRQTQALFDPDWCVVMDDDARPEVGAIARFRAMDCGSFGGVAAAVYTTDGSICDMNRPSVNPFWDRKAFLRTLMGRGRMGFHLGNDAYEALTATPIDAASFVGLFLSRSAIKATGFPDGRLFIYGDDVLYTLAMRRAGHTIMFVPGIRFEHDFKTFAAESRAFRPLWKIYYHHRNLLFVYHSAAGVWFWPALLIILPKWFMKVRYYGGDWALYLKFLQMALIDASRGKLDRSHAEVLSWSSR
jgi:GT2 family glycosyltransferase